MPPYFAPWFGSYFDLGSAAPGGASVDYFDCDYFDPTYFDTPDCGTSGGHPPRRIRFLPVPELPLFEDDELLALI